MPNQKLNVPASELPMNQEPRDFRAMMPWRVFRIMAEFMDGWQFLADFRNAVAVFGSASIGRDTKYYNQAVAMGLMLADEGYSVVTEGGPGIMEAANKGASSSTANYKGDSLGLNVKLSRSIRANSYLKKSVAFHYFFVRSLMMSYSARAYVYFPGGLGTLDHLTAMITLVQTKKVAIDVPIILIGKEFWAPTADWINRIMYSKYKAIDKEDMQLYTIVDTPEEALALVKKAPKRAEFFLRD